MCLGYVWKRNVVCSLMLYNKIQRSRGSTSQSDFSLTIPGLTGIDFEPRQEKNREENLLEQRIEERSNNNSRHLWRGHDASI